jgi:regulator of protease activity HflC (stomatin/prohibitin superfamily)
VLIPPTLIAIVVVAFYLLSSIKILNEYERAVVFRLGKLLDRPKGPGSSSCSRRSIAWRG